MALTDMQESAMTSAVNSLKQQVSDANLSLVGSWTDTFFGDSASRDAKQGALAADSQRILDLDGRLRDAVRNGTLSIDAWKGIAQSVADDITYQSGIKSLGLPDFWTDVVGKTVTDVKDVGAKVVAKLPDADSLPYYLAAGIAVLVLILAIKVT